MPLPLPLRLLACGLLLPLGSTLAQDNPFLANDQAEETTQAAAESSSGSELLDASISIDFTTRPEDNGGNLFLVGFEQVDEMNMPSRDARPADFKQLGVWIKSWPHTQKVELLASLHYMVLYGYSEYPSPKDLSSKALHTDQMVNGVLSLTIEDQVRSENDNDGLQPNQPPEQADQVVEKIPDILQEAPTNIVVQFTPPPEKQGGTLFLTGFKDIDESMMLPLRGAEPIHFEILAENVQSANVESSARLQVDLGYLVIYGHGLHPESGDRMSLATMLKENASLLLAIENQQAGTPPKEVLEEAAASTEASPTATTGATPKKSSKIWIVFPVTLMVLFGVLWIQRKPSIDPTTSRLERVGESEEDS